MQGSEIKVRVRTSVYTSKMWTLKEQNFNWLTLQGGDPGSRNQIALAPRGKYVRFERFYLLLNETFWYSLYTRYLTVLAKN